MDKKRDLTSALIAATVIATTAVITSAAAISYILYKRYQSLKSLSFSSSGDGYDDIFSEGGSESDIETILISDDE